MALTTENIRMIKEFRTAIATIDLDGQRFLSIPKQMLVKKYALTIYFGRPFHRFTSARLMYWLGCATTSGERWILWGHATSPRIIPTPGGEVPG